MTSNLLDLNTEKKKKNEKKVLSDLVEVFKITRKYYEELRPHFKYRMVFNLAKNILDFRDCLNYEIRILKSKLKEEVDNEKMEH